MVYFFKVFCPSRAEVRCNKERKIVKRLKVSNNVIRRLPRYLRKLDELNAEGVTRISSGELGKQLGLTPSQIRQDFSSFGDFGQQGYGYNVLALRKEIATILGMDRGMRAILIGVGNIGSALINNFEFSNCGFTLDCAFDVKPALVGTAVNGILVHAATDLKDYIASHQVDAAVLCVPKGIAVKMTEELESYGIQAIWNFTNVEITEPNSSMLVENMHFSDSLLALSYYISDRRDETAARQHRTGRE